MKTLRMTTFITTLSFLFAGAANASNILNDGQFFNPIGVGTCGNGNWCDWTNAGITTSPMTNVFLGNYASLPNSPNGGADLFQDFSPLAPGTYTLSFLVQNASSWSAELVFGLNQYLGVPTAFAFSAGWQTEILLPASSNFTLDSLTFVVTNSEPYTANEITFSNSYDAPVGPISNSMNPAGTVINVADVSLTANTPLPAAFPLFATGLDAMGLFGWRRKRKNFAALAVA